MFDEAANDYDKLVELYDRIIEQDDDIDEDDGKSYILVEKSVNTKWKKNISDRLKTMQADCLEKICGTISGLDYTALVSLYDDTKNRYVFHRDVLDKYLAIIAKPIDEYENSVLGKLCANSDDLPSAEYERILAEIEKLNFKKSNTKKYHDDISQKLSNARLLESCDEKYLEDYDLDQLNDRVKAVHFSTFSSEKKSELNSRITHYIDLIYDCKDKKNVKLLSDCEPEKAAKLSVRELYVIDSELQNHSRLSPEIRDELITRIENLIHIKEFDRIFVAAGDDYDRLLSAKEALPNANLPKAESDKYDSLICSKLLAAQKDALAKLTAVPADEKHDGICRRIVSAKHYDFDKSVLDEALASLEAARNDFECKMLQRMYGNIDACTFEELVEAEEIEDKINQLWTLDFKAENLKPYFYKLMARGVEIIIEVLNDSCTPDEIAEAAETEDELEQTLSNIAFADTLNEIVELRYMLRETDLQDLIAKSQEEFEACFADNPIPGNNE